MPDWTTHVGGAYLVGRPWVKEDLCYFLLGAILPDLFSRFDAITTDVLGLDLFHHYNLEAFHTPFMIFLLALLIGLFTSRSRYVFGLIFGGGMLHFFMDMLEKKVSGIGTPMLFPFSYNIYQIGLVHLFGPSLYIGWMVVLFVFMYAVWEKKNNNIQMQFAGKRLWVGLLLLVILTVPYLADNLYKENNVGFSQFFKNPATFEGKQVSVHSAEVIKEEPLTVYEQFKTFTVVTNQRFKKGDWISMEGVYREGKIYPSYIQHEQGVWSKSLLSMPALLLFPLLWWDWRKGMKVLDLASLKSIIKQFFSNLQPRGADEEEG